MSAFGRYLALAVLALSSCAPGSTSAPSPSPSGGIGTATSAQASASDPCHEGGVTYCELNPAVTQATIKSTICVSGWTATIRPPSTYTTNLKRQQIASQHLSDTNLADYEEDHRAALEVGGAPSDPHNLSPELHPASFVKDADENTYHRLVCNASLTLEAAQRMLIAKWLAPYPGYKSP